MELTRLMRFAVLGILALLLPLSGYARVKVTKLQGPYSVGNKHAKHNTYNYLGKKNKHQAKNHYRSPVTGQILAGKPKS